MNDTEIPICVLPHAAGWHVASWRRAGVPKKEIGTPNAWIRLAQTAGRASGTLSSSRIWLRCGPRLNIFAICRSCGPVGSVHPPFGAGDGHRTQAVADAKWHELQSLAYPDLARGVLEAMIGINWQNVSLDEAIPQDRWGDVAVTGYRDTVMDYVRDRNCTARKLIFEYKGPGNVVGTPEVIADYIEAEVDGGSCDGFNLLIHGNPEELEDFVDLGVPELQRSGRFKTEYRGKTLRENLVLPRPSNRFADQ